MPSPSSPPYTLRVPRRRIVLVAPPTRFDRADVHRRHATDDDRDYDVIAGPQAELKEAATDDASDTSSTDYGIFDLAQTPPSARFSSLSDITHSLDMSPMSLNSEPAAPQEREAHNLPPKSYADAAEEGLFNDAPAQGNGAAKENKAKNLASIQTNGVITPPADDKEQYEGAGQDSSPRSPTRGHRRVSSKKSNGSLGRKHGEQLQKDMFEKHQDANGKALTSVKPSDDYEEETQTSAQPKERDSLTSGRQAGAGWHTSK